jgi:hypothetical protein
MQLTASKLLPAARAELAARLAEPPTYAEFVERLIKPRGGPTAGLTGLTFNMMAEWPEEVMKSVYSALCKLEAEGTTPLHWKNKGLIPMPKAPNPSLEQLRPLMLIEVLRKVWCGFSVNTVWNFLERNHVLEEIQFAYRRNREAGVAQLCLRNAIEEAQESESAILLGSYDLYHAFDSLTRAAMKLSFNIVGLTATAAAKLVDTEKDSRVTVLTPIARHHWATKYTRTLHRGEASASEPSFFIPFKGTPQGDTISCLTWTVFENICLATLCKDPGRVKLYIRGADGLIHEAADLCYADDLNTISPTLQGMQRKADIIGGIAEALHLKISIKKLRQIAVDFGSQALIPKPCSLDVNDGTGKIESVTIPPKGPFDQLGYKYSVGVYPVNQRPDLDQFIRLKIIPHRRLQILEAEKCHSAVQTRRTGNVSVQHSAVAHSVLTLVTGDVPRTGHSCEQATQTHHQEPSGFLEQSTLRQSSWPQPRPRIGPNANSQTRPRRARYNQSSSHRRWPQWTHPTRRSHLRARFYPWQPHDLWIRLAVSLGLLPANSPRSMLSLPHHRWP